MKFLPKKAHFFEPGLGHPGLSRRSTQAKISQLSALLGELDLAGGAPVLGLGFWFSEKTQVKIPTLKKQGKKASQRKKPKKILAAGTVRPSQSTQNP